jgi:hypothetical protein
MSHPLILQLNSGGEPSRWIKYDRAAFYYAKGLVSWSLGSYEYNIYGGKSRHTGERSFMVLPSMIAVKGKGGAISRKPYTIPTLTNRSLFRRDHNVCAYCGQLFHTSELTRDHVIPSSKGGPDTWDNVVTACGPCNRHKDDRTPLEAGMPLLFQPYVPTQAEYLILKNPTILPDQRDFLMRNVKSSSRLLDDNFLTKYAYPQ